MFSEYSKHSNYINVPYRLAKRYRKNKRMWDLLVFAICLKLYSGSSALRVDSAYKVMKMFRCSYRKAERLIEQAKNCPALFSYYPNAQYLVARSFKRGCEWTWNKRQNKKLYRDDCIAIEKKSDGIISHYEISTRLRDMLMYKAIKAYQNKMSSNCHFISRQGTIKPLTQKFISNIAGCCRSTVTRHLNKAAKQTKDKKSEIKITSHPIIPVYDILDGEVINDIPNMDKRKTFIRSHYACVRDANEYELTDEKFNYIFKHIIYNHKGRRTQNKVYQHWEI